MINFKLGSFENSFVSINVLNLNVLSKNNISTDSNKTNSFDLYKLHLLSLISKLYETSHFEVDNPTMNIELVKSFYNVAIKLTIDLDVTPSQFEYYKLNFGAKNISGKSELTEYLINQRNNISTNGSRYLLGFRSVYFILRENIEKIDCEYFLQIIKMLKPFFVNYKHKELFIPNHFSC
tara:strand:+ start:252 stop:788 length:537 start_codon:yes stop_codon:yes gene_type:complete